MKKEKVLIIGSGPAGLTAAMYTGRAMLEPVVIVGDQLGGQIALSSEVENYPGFDEVISGQALIDHMVKQAEKFGYCQHQSYQGILTLFPRHTPLQPQQHALPLSPLLGKAA